MIGLFDAIVGVAGMADRRVNALRRASRRHPL
jgi:hypothetical protein